MADLAELLLLMHGARHRFRTVRAEVAERHHTERHLRAFERRAAARPGTAIVSVAAAGPGAEPTPEWSETITRVRWAKPDRLRLERGDSVEVVVGERWWSISDAFGAVAGDPSSDVQMGIQNPPFPALLDPAVLLPDLDLEVTGEGRLGDRAVLEVRGLPRGEREDWAEPHVSGGADEHRLAVDAEVGVVLRLESRIDGEPFAVTEVREIAFDEAFPDATWVLEPPPGRSFGPLALRDAPWDPPPLVG